MYRTAEEINEAITQCLIELREIALEDQIITQDERAILDKIEEDFKNLQNQVIQVLESDLPEDEFQDIILDFLDDTVENVVNIAMEDGTITKDEQNLINRLKEFSGGND